jgi:hypothetical protein
MAGGIGTTSEWQYLNSIGFTNTASWGTTNYSLALGGTKFARIIGTPVAPSAPAPAPAPISIAPQLPDPSLAGQAWGWPIPITAGKRPGLPGRPVRRRVTKVGENSWILDALISFGWRAEVMARFDPATFDATKLLANGVDIWEKDVFTFQAAGR